MAVRRVQLRRGTTAQNEEFTGAVGEITVDTTTKSIRVHDGAEAGGFDLMRTDMSNNLAIATDINFTNADHTIGGAIDGNILTIGQVNTAISIPGTLTVANYVTQNDLLIQDKVIVIADGTEGAANSTDSIGLLFTRTTDGPGPGAAQNPALFYWDEATDRFRIETNNVTEGDANWSAGATGSDLTLANLYATTSVDVNNGNITNVTQIELDTITFADAGTVLTINLEDGLNDKALTIKDGGDTEYLTINTNAESTTLGVVAKTTTFLSNDIDIGSDAANDVVIEVVARTGDNDGQDLTIKAGSAADSDDNLGGDLILASGSGVEVGGTSSIQFQTKVDGTVGVSEAMRIHTTGYVGIGENAPDSGLHIKGNDAKAVLTLENSTGGNDQDDDPTTISFKGSGEALALAQIVGAHDGAADDDKGVLIFKPNNDGGTTEALRLDSSLKATFAGAIEVASGLDLTDSAITNVTDIALDSITADDANTIAINLAQAGGGTALTIKDDDGAGVNTLFSVDATNDASKVSITTNTFETSATTEVNLLGNVVINEGGADKNFRVEGTGQANALVVDGTNGNVGIGVLEPGTMLQIEGANAYLTLKNETDEFNDGGAETKIIFEDHSNTSLAQIQASHDGGVEDTKGDLIFSTHNNVTLTEALRLDSAQLATFAGAVKLEGASITGKTDNNLSIISDADLIFQVDGDNDGANSFQFNNGAGAEIANLNESGNLQLDGSLTVSGSSATVLGAANTSADLYLKADEGADNGDNWLVSAQDGSSLLVQNNVTGAQVTQLTLLGADPATNSLATFAGNVTVSGNTLTFGNGATIVNGGANTLTITEPTVAFSADVQVGGNITADQSEAKTIFNNVTDSQITIGSADTANTDTVLVRQLVVVDDIDVSGAGALVVGATVGANNLTLGGATSTVVSAGDLTVNGGANTAVLTLGQDQAQDSQIIVSARTGANDGQDLTIEAGSTATDVGNQNGGDLILSSGGGDGNGTSNLILKTKISGSDAPTEKIRVIGSGFMGIGETSPDSILHLSHASAPTITLQNLTGGNNEGDRANVLTFVGETGAGAEGELGNITVSHDTAVADQAGKIVFSTYATVDWQAGAVNAVSPVLTLDSTQQATFAGSVIIAGNLQVDGTTTTINTATLDVEDTVIRLNKGQAGAVNTNDIGIYFERGDANDDGGVDNDPSAIFYWDEGDDIFKLGLTTSAHTATDFGANTTLGGLQLGSIVLKDDEEIALDIKIQDPDNTSMMKFVTSNGSEEIVFGKIFTSESGSKIGNITISNGSIASDTDAITFGNDTLTTSGVCDFGATTVDSLNASSGGITLAGAISGVSSIAGSDLDINLTDNEATSLEVKGDVKANGTQSYLTFVTTNTTEEVVFNQGGVDIDFRVEGDGDANLIFARASDDKVGIKTANPQFDLDITGTLGVSGIADLNGGIDVNGSKFKVSTTGLTTLEDSLKINKAGSDTGIVFNANRGAEEDKNGANFDAILLHVEDGGSDATDAYLKWDDSESSFTVDGGKLHSNTNFSVGTVIGTQNFTVSTAGVVVSVGGITDTTVASAFATGTTLGNVTYNNNEIVGADAEDLTIKSKQDIIFNIDSDNNDGAGKKFSFSHNENAEIASLNDSGDLTLTGDLTVQGNDIDFVAGDANIGATVGANLLTLGGATTTTKVAGDLRVTGNDIQDSGNASAITFDGSQNTNFNGNVSIDTTKSLTLNSGVADAAADVDASIIVDRGTDDNVAIRWDEGDNRWMHTNDGTNYYNILNANDTLFTFDADGDANSITIEQTDGTTVLFEGASAIKNTGLEFTINGSSVVLSFENAVAMPGTLNVDGTATLGNCAVEGQLLAEGNDIDFDDGSNATLGANLGANNLTIGGSTSTVVLAGDLKVEGNLVYDSSTLTLTAGGEITVTKPYHKVELNDQGNATENLVSINAAGVVAGTVLVLQAFHTDRSVVVKNTNFKLAGNADFTLDNTEDTISLIYNGTHWCELTRSNNNA